MTREQPTVRGRARGLRFMLVAVVMAVSVSGCGGPRALLGIHEGPTAMTTTVPLTSDHARRVLTRVFTAAYKAETMTGAAAAPAQRMAYTGEGLRAVRARVRLASIQPKTKDSPFLAPQKPHLLAVSRGFGFPRFIVAQTAASKGGVPILHLLTSPDAATPYRISASVEMVSLAKIKPFDPLSLGSPRVTDSRGLAVAPSALMERYATSMAYPARSGTNLTKLTKLPFTADTFSSQLRAQAAGVARDVSSQAKFSQVHKVLTSSTYAVQQASGDALVFGVIQRRDSFEVKPDQAVRTSANKAFVLLTGKNRVTESASMTTLEFVVFAVPRATGRATLVAAQEQVVAGSGS